MGKQRRRVFDRASALVLAAACLTGFASSCGKSVRHSGDEDAGGGTRTGGTRPSGGDSGVTTGGLGGTQAGRGGSGPATGGLGGTQAGRGGTSEPGGSGGTNEPDPGGTGGGAGCEDGEVPNSLAHCPAVPLKGGQPSSSCDFEVTCGMLRCGEPWSDFDAQGCRRLPCRSEADCAAGERCVAAVLDGNFECFSSVQESCEWFCGCSCSSSDDCRAGAFCQPAADFPKEDDCALDALDCTDVAFLRLRVTDYIVDGGFESEVARDLSDCADAVEVRYDECFP